MLSNFSFHNCLACSNYDAWTDSEAADLHRKGTGHSNLENKIFGNDADEGTLQITTWDRGTTQWACTTSQWGEQWWQEEPQGAEGCIWEGSSCRHQGETEQCVVPSGTDSRCNNPYADETWLCGRERHRRWSKGLEAFARDFRVWRRRQWLLWWQSLLDCSSRIPRIWIASSSEDRSCSQGYKKEGKQSQRPSSTPWSSMGCQWGVKVLLYRKALTWQRTSQSWGKGCWTSMRAQHRGAKDQVVQWQWSVTSRREGLQQRTLFCVWDPWTLCQGLQEEGDSTMQQVWWEGSPRQGMQETKRWRQTWVSGNGSNIGFTRLGIIGSSHPVEDSRHVGGQWLYRSHSDEHRCVSGLCAHSISSQKSLWRGFRSGGQRLCEDQHTLK